MCIWYNDHLGWLLARVSTVTQAKKWVIYDGEEDEYNVTKVMVEKEYGKKWAFVSAHSFLP